MPLDPPLSPPPGGAAVRMYRLGGLGDCFLLAFRPPAGAVGSDGDDRVRHVLIDCGVFFRTPGEAERMQAVAEDVRAVVGERLDVLVVTHEHWDHTSGFRWAREIFRELPIDEVWLGWTEDPAHPLGRKLREERQESLGLLARVVGRLDELAAEAEALGLGARESRREAQEARRIEEIARFFGELPPVAGPAAAPRAAELLGADADDLPTTASQMDAVRRLGRRRRFHRPGTVVADALPGVRVYVLGPPEDEELLLRSHPRKGEVYEKEDDPALAPGAAVAAGLFAALPAADAERLDVDQRLLRDRLRPFGEPFPIPFEEAAEDELHGAFFRRRYGFPGGDERQGAAWRRVDADWLGAAGELALALDGDTNNTSLALAFELADGRVLLFPGDAQVGNWLSWHRHAWRPSGADGPKVDADDLLARTVLYKVGHHASHNATLRGGGLEKMTHRDLVALVPVDEAQAAKKRWAMPFGPLRRRLRERTGGRVVRADVGIEPPAEDDPPAGGVDADFEARVDVQELWIDYVLPAAGE